MRRIRAQERGTTILFVSHDASAVRALCSRAILLGAGRLLVDGTPTDALNHYQRLIMAREEAYAEAQTSGQAEAFASSASIEEQRAGLRYTYRHGNESAEIIYVALLNADDQQIEIVESGEAVRVRVRLVARRDLEAVVCGILIRNRHGIDVYGTNTEMHRLDAGPLARGAVVEATFSFDCWLAPDSFSLTVAAHSPAAESYDWLDGALFFRVVSQIQHDGIANLNAAVTTRILTGHTSIVKSGQPSTPVA
ncbi:MAG: Wzt carbohydrate-binding domain-containing protein [Pyrinomonadaceae bacterium]